MDRRLEDSVRAVLTVNGYWLRGQRSFPPSLLIEVLAQAAILLLPETGEGGRGLLAGIDQASFEERPVVAGEELQVTVARAGSFGRLAKVVGSVSSVNGSVLCQAHLLLARDG